MGGHFMTEIEEQIVKAIWGSSDSKCSKFCTIEHSQNDLNPDDSIRRGRIFLLSKTQKRVS
jgi:hypothetical protein